MRSGLLERVVAESSRSLPLTAQNHVHRPHDLHPTPRRWDLLGSSRRSDGAELLSAVAAMERRTRWAGACNARVSPPCAKSHNTKPVSRPTYDAAPESKNSSHNCCRHRTKSTISARNRPWPPYPYVPICAATDRNKQLPPPGIGSKMRVSLGAALKCGDRSLPQLLLASAPCRALQDY